MSSIQAWSKGIRGKLLFSAILPVLGFGGISLVAYRGVTDLGEMLHKAHGEIIPIQNEIGNLETGLNAIARWSWFGIGTAGNNENRNRSLEKLKKSLSNVEDALKNYRKFSKGKEAQDAFAPFEENWPKAREMATNLLSILEKRTSEGDAQARQILIDYRPVSTAMDTALENTSNIYDHISAKAEEEANAEVRMTILLTIIAGFACSAAVFVVLLWISVRLSNALGRIASFLTSSADQVASSSQQLSAAGQGLSESSTESAASLEQTVSSLEELSSMVTQNANNAREASSLSQNSRKEAEHGESEINRLIVSMNDISQSSRKIEEIINVIDDIAFQTNLLALNAAVEAARAGEQGKGFAVVAEAVRALAQRSATAAKDITTLIQESVAKVETGTKVADQSGSVLKNIVVSVKKVADLNSEIASASQEQSTGISQISKAMNQLDQSTQTNASSAEEVAASSEEMSSQASALKEMVGELIMIVHGNSTQPAQIQPSTVTPARSRSAPTQNRGPQLRLVRASSIANKANLAEKTIPFEDTEPSAKVGNTDGF